MRPSDERHERGLRALLEESEQRYRSLFDNNPDAVYSLDTEGHFVSANPACQRLSGYAPEELRGQSFVPLVPAERVASALAHFRTAVSGTATRFEAAIHHRDGRLVQLDVTNIPIIVDGDVVGVFGIAKDRTAQLELEGQLRQAQKMEAVGRLAGGVAHDFNNLLTVIQSYTSFAAEQLPETSAARADLARALQAAERAAALTRQLLAFSRQQVLKPRLLDLNETVTSVVGMLRRVIGEDIALATELAPALWPVLADPGQLEQVLMNLVVNARDAMPAGGVLRIRTAKLELEAPADASAPEPATVPPGDYVALIVEDTGAGIAPEVMPHIFEPFYTTKRDGLGTGLGLPTVYGIVTQSGGQIHAESAPGEGSRFTVLLPRAQGSAEEPTPRATGTPKLRRGTETVLLIEDEEAVRAAVRRQLERLGYTVREAGDGAAALRIAAREARLDVVLTDLVMPGLSGRSLVDRLLALRPGLRIVLMSGYTDDEVLRRGITDAGTIFLEKPFVTSRLAEALRDALEPPGERGAP